MDASQPRVRDHVRQAMRRNHASIRTEEASVSWIKRSMLFHHKRHPNEMGAAEVEASLTHLAVHAHVAASTQNQALSALRFLSAEVLRQPLNDAIRAGASHH